jgi:MSHA biogenesis protein MshE
MARPEKVRLGELLVRQQLISEEQLKAALEQQKGSGRKLGRIFVESGFVTEEQISGALARQLQVPYINLKQYNLNPGLVQLLSEAQARRFRALVLEEVQGAVRVGMVDPTDLFAYDEIGRILKRELQLAVVTESQLLTTVDRVYRRTGEITQLSQELTAELAQTEADFGALLGVAASVEDAPVVKLLQSLFEDAVQVRASDIHIEPQERKLQIRFRIDGVLHLQMETDSKIAPALVLRLKLVSGLDISEKRLPQDGRFHMNIRGNAVDVRISSMPTQYGESVVMRLLNQGSGLLGLERLGMPQRILERVRHAIARPSGMVLVTGPTGSGKTTSLYAALSEINTPERKIITVEDPVEYRLPGINQVQVHEKIDLTFERVLRSALRQDPDVILVGEMRDRATAEIGLRAAMTGHMVLSTLHTNDAASTPIRLLDMGVPPYMVAMSLNLVLAQRLLRVVCENCAQPHVPTPQEQEWLRTQMDGQQSSGSFAKGQGCSQCNGTGYVGRTGVYEMLEMTHTLVEAANHSEPGDFVRLARQQIGKATLMHDAMRLALTGRTTIEEAMRISAQIDD